MRFVLVMAMVILSSGCARGLYQWDGYNTRLYNYYENPSSAEEFIAALETHLNRLHSTGKKPAPGLHAELGTLYLQKGDRHKALEHYTSERDTWPESKRMMSALIANLSIDKQETSDIKE